MGGAQFDPPRLPYAAATAGINHPHRHAIEIFAANAALGRNLDFKPVVGEQARDLSFEKTRLSRTYKKSLPQAFKALRACLQKREDRIAEPIDTIVVPDVCAASGMRPALN